MVAELKHPLAPISVQDWAGNAPSWVEILTPKSSLTLGQLDLGESEAMALAAEVNADVLLIDEQAGRQEAVRRGLRVAGTLPFLMKLTKPVSSTSMTRSRSFKRPASAFRRRCSQRSGQSGLADSLDSRLQTRQ